MPSLHTTKQLIEKYEPAADYGFFGPDSVTWKVWSYPTSYILGFARAVTIEHLDPNLTAAVVQSGGVKYRPHTRYGRTLRYFGMVAFGATEPTARAADVLVKVHTKAIGTDPVTNSTYDANKPSSQLWIHMTAWHSILYCYEKFGPGRLSAEEEAQFWKECARAAELQTIDPNTVPRTREEVIAYFEDWRPHLASSEAAQDMVDFILRLDVALPPDMPKWQKLAFAPALELLSAGVIATYPQYMRELLNVKQSPLTDQLAVKVLKPFHAVVARTNPLKFWLMELIAPQAVQVAAPAFLGIPPLNPITMTPREAQEKYGFDAPNDAHKDMRAKQYDRVFGKGLTPSDEGLIESEQHIGSIAPLHSA
ncbi:DUF2236 domain-containing protein [Hoyosella rhizosphaerae]|uniref:ER-bound oxygenase mpaB/mpaB'/Rubber oxygenase catalytic domain-containing protein n=1 Tax=Hoyosella rhizosphaerae TaxID=1755582 RepID=A0A916UKC4_9ACTN|nr:oxygenase MpaB family protein [Hoyosella rhizosphaerae]MBN4925474.1 DUF2236 domain-containing protein [Hoyosella rhizosphaerae]GGC74891.1 hypothetical protein GCM10011410_30240 [Hoyosella rhizosphaerae]